MKDTVERAGVGPHWELQFVMTRVVYQFPWAAIAKHQNWVTYHNSNSLSHSSRGYKSRITVLVGLYSLSAVGGVHPASSSF